MYFEDTFYEKKTCLDICYFQDSTEKLFLKATTIKVLKAVKHG